MPLDQNCHGECERLWRQVKVEASRLGETMSTKLALYCIRSILGVAFAPRILEASWRRIGFADGCRVNVDKVLVDRHAEVFRVQKKELTYEDAASAASIAVRAVVQGYAAKHPCAECSHVILDAAKHCEECTAPNVHFSILKNTVGNKSRKRFTKRDPTRPTIDDEMEADPARTEELGRHLGDLLKSLKSRASGEEQGSTAPKAGSSRVAPTGAPPDAAPLGAQAPIAQDSTVTKKGACEGNPETGSRPIF